MRAAIDQTGRIVVPKAMRDRCGLFAGAEIELEGTGGGIALSRFESEPALVRRNGVLVYTGKIATGVDDARLIEADREERMRQIGGWRRRTSTQV